MRYYQLLPALLLACFTTPAAAQQPGLRNVPNLSVGIGHHATDSLRTQNLSIGLLSVTDSLQGVQAGLLTSMTRRYTGGLNLGGLSVLSWGDVRGAQIALGPNTVGGKLRGVQLSAITNLARRAHGMQVAGFANVVTSPFRGTQLSAITNIARGVELGMQISAFANVSSMSMRGLQIGGYNYADTLSGWQVGLLNVAQNHPRGWQIGLFNYSKDTAAHKIGLVNISPKTRIDVLAYVGNTSLFNVALRFRNHSTYSMVGLGTHYMGLDEKFSGAVFYRVGQYFSLSPRWTLSGDLGYYHVETFEQNSQSKPLRLYSLQAHVNADYQVSPSLGLFVSAGYGNTRYYAHNRKYKNGLVAQMGLSFNWRRHGSSAAISAPEASPEAYQTEMPDSLWRLYAFHAPWNAQKHYWRAAAQTAGINMLVWGFDRFVTNEDFAHITLNAWKSNFKHAFVWDNDPFHTNTFFHPYHGSLYFNAARSNGLSFWESVPYAFGGSLMWEFLGECEPPAINDLFATSMGGIALGEITRRVSHLILNDRKRGFGRFMREFTSLILNPSQEFLRLTSGDAWRVRDEYYKYHDYDRLPIDFSLSTGIRYLADDGALFRGEANPYLNFFLEYGDAFNMEENKPFDFFYAEATFGLSANQPLINTVHLLGRLWGRSIETHNDGQFQFGVFQHFNYYDSRPVKNGTSLTPYLISEAASLGPGMLISLPSTGLLTRLEQRIFLSGIFLGGYKTDYYNVIDRDYNMGSGYSIKTKTHMELRNFGRFILHANYFRLFTWKGYEGKDLENINPLFLNAQGDKGNAELLEINPIWEFDFKGPVSAVISSSYYARTSRYKYHSTVRAHTFEMRMGVTYHF